MFSFCALFLIFGTFCFIFYDVSCIFYRLCFLIFLSTLCTFLAHCVCPFFCHFMTFHALFYILFLCILLCTLCTYFTHFVFTFCLSFYDISCIVLPEFVFCVCLSLHVCHVFHYTSPGVPVHIRVLILIAAVSSVVVVHVSVQPSHVPCRPVAVSFSCGAIQRSCLKPDIVLPAVCWQLCCVLELHVPVVQVCRCQNMCTHSHLLEILASCALHVERVTFWAHITAATLLSFCSLHHAVHAKTEFPCFIPCQCPSCSSSFATQGSLILPYPRSLSHTCNFGSFFL